MLSKIFDKFYQLFLFRAQSIIQHNAIKKLSTGIFLNIFIHIFSIQLNACPVCYEAKDEVNRWAYYGTTAFLSLLPFLIFFGMGYWVYQKFIK